MNKSNAIMLSKFNIMINKFNVKMLSTFYIKALCKPTITIALIQEVIQSLSDLNKIVLWGWLTILF